MELATKNIYQEKKLQLFDHLLMGLAAALVLGVCAPLRIYLPFTPVPFVMQNTLIIFFAAFLGRKAAMTMILSFLAQGAMGLPVFASGYVGLAAFVGPTGGYLIGYAIAAFVVSTIFQARKVKTPLRLFSDLLVGTLIVLVIGTLGLSAFLGSLEKAFYLGFLPYFVGDVMKCLMLTSLAYGITGKRSHFPSVEG